MPSYPRSLSNLIRSSKYFASEGKRLNLPSICSSYQVNHSEPLTLTKFLLYLKMFVWISFWIKSSVWNKTVRIWNIWKWRKFGVVKRRKSRQIFNLTFNAVLFRMFPIHFTMHGVPCFCFNITPTFAIELDPKVPRKKSCAYQQQQQQQQAWPYKYISTVLQKLF